MWKFCFQSNKHQPCRFIPVRLMLFSASCSDFETVELMQLRLTSVSRTFCFAKLRHFLPFFSPRTIADNILNAYENGNLPPYSSPSEDKGYLLSFNFNQSKQIGTKNVQVGNKTVFEAVV